MHPSLPLTTARRTDSWVPLALPVLAISDEFALAEPVAHASWQLSILQQLASSPAKKSITAAKASLIVMAIVAWAACFPAAARAGDDGVLAERRARIEQMDETEKDQLRKKSERFAKLEPAERERLRALYEQIEQDPRRTQLEQVMQRYSEWLSTLTPFERAELAKLESQERVEMIEQIRDKQAQDSSRRLSHEDAAAFSKWFVARLIAHKDKRQLPPQMLSQLENPGLREPLEIMGALFSPWAGRRYDSPKTEKRPGDQKPGEKKKDRRDPRDDPRSSREPFGRLEALRNLLPPPSDEELAALKSVLSSQASGQLALAKTIEDRQRLFINWVRQAIGHSFSQRVSREDLNDFFEKLPEEDQRRLLTLSKEDSQRELRGMYFSRKRMQQRGPDRSDGPPRGPEGRPRRPGQGPPPSIP